MDTKKKIRTYKVGGCVRDSLLGLPIRENDYVITGADEAYMKKNRFIRVGRSFPVFLHPVTFEEYALARREYTTGLGHQDFCADIDDISLEVDLVRRDFTINAIAMDRHGNYIDPIGGMHDIKKKIIRHVSNAFEEDPLRIYRLARFYSRLQPLGFTIAEDTLKLVQGMLHRDMHKNISVERILLELKKVMSYDQPEIFFIFLNSIGVCKDVFPFYTQAHAQQLSMIAKAYRDIDLRLLSICFYPGMGYPVFSSYFYLQEKRYKYALTALVKYYHLFTNRYDIQDIARMLLTIRHAGFNKKYALAFKAAYILAILYGYTNIAHQFHYYISQYYKYRRPAVPKGLNVAAMQEYYVNHLIQYLQYPKLL